MLRAVVVSVAISACVCLSAHRVTSQVVRRPSGYTPTKLERISYWPLAPGILLMAAVLPHHPVDSPEETPPSPLIIPAVVGVSIACWAALLTLLYLLTRYSKRKARVTRPI
jgi:hypothetical protein